MSKLLKFYHDLKRIALIFSLIKIRLAVEMNIIGTKKVITLAKKIKNLEVSFMKKINHDRELIRLFTYQGVYSRKYCICQLWSNAHKRGSLQLARSAWENNRGCWLDPRRFSQTFDSKSNSTKTKYIYVYKSYCWNTRISRMQRLYTMCYHSTLYR